MALIFTILVIIVIGIIALYMGGKENIKKIMVPFIILIISDFLFLYAKVVVGDDFLTLLIYLPATILLLISCIWLGIILIRSILKNDRKRISTISFCLIITAITKKTLIQIKS